MRDCVRDAFLAFTQRYEGHTLYCYLDEEGLVSIGYGNLIDPHIPACLDFRDLHGIPATTDQVQAEWAHIKSLQNLKELGGGAYRPHANLRATEASILALVAHERDGMWAKLLGYFPDAEDWPADAQLGVMSMAWACGAGFPDPHDPVGFPKFTAAARAREWVTCANECHIEDSKNPGVTPRNVMNRKLFLAAAATSTPDQLSP